MSNAPNEMVQRIENAKSAIVDAQRELALVISEMQSGRRAEKRHIGEPLEEALGRLQVAQTELAALESLLTK